MNIPAEISAQISAFLDGELTEKESAGLKEMLMKECRWRKRLDEFRGLNDMLDRWDKVEMKNIHASANYERCLIERLRILCFTSRLNGHSPDASSLR